MTGNAGSPSIAGLRLAKLRLLFSEAANEGPFPGSSMPNIPAKQNITNAKHDYIGVSSRSSNELPWRPNL